MISYYTHCAFRTADEVQLEFLVIMQGKIKTRFYPGKKSETIVLRKRCNLS